jgi:sigma-B regulation protein RsbU (phosphoserine phosphatase)
MSTTMTEKPTRMSCMEIWGGNQATDQSFVAPGIDIYVHSAPYMASEVGGGDIYYLTSCASGRISRMLLADVSGHGATAADVAVALRDLLRENVNKISQTQFVEGMNREFGRMAEDSCFATAIVATYFEPTRTLSLSIAGHPYPFYYSSARNEWVHLDPQVIKDNDIGNLPLGILEESSYPGRKIKTQAGDMFLLYSDALIESVHRNDEQLGMAGILDLLNGMGTPDPKTVIPNLRSALESMSEGNLLDDDATMILGHLTSTKTRLRDNLMAPIRLLGEVCDNTRLSNSKPGKN